MYPCIPQRGTARGEGSLTSASLLGSQRHRPSSQWELGRHLLTAPGSGGSPHKSRLSLLSAGCLRVAAPLSGYKESATSFSPQRIKCLHLSTGGLLNQQSQHSEGHSAGFSALLGRLLGVPGSAPAVGMYQRSPKAQGG